MLEQVGMFCGQDPAQEVHPECGRHTNTGVLIHAGTEHVEELGTFPFAGEGDHFLELIDYQKHAPETAAAQPGQLDFQGIRPLAQPPQDGGHLFLSVTRGRQGGSQSAERVRAGGEDGHERPPMLPQPWDHTGFDQ
nr:hypothetical protein [Streptomyces finlayi]